MSFSLLPRPNPHVALPSPADASARRDVRAAFSRHLRIVHIVSSLNVGGMEQFVLRIAHAQQTQGHQVLVIALQGGPLLEAVKRDGIRACVLGGTGKISKVRRMVHCLSVLARFRPDVINAHNQTSLHYATLGKRIGKPQVILINHGQGRGSVRTPDAKEWGRTDAIVAVSQDVAARMDTPELASKICVIHNGITPTPPRRSRAEVRHELSLDSEGCVGILVARIDGLKGHDTLLHALAHLRAMKTPVTFLMVGDGAERVPMERLAGELGLGPEWVRFLGFRNDIPDLLAASDVFTLPSLTEGLPLSVLEAMAQRLPVVATCVGGIPELVTHNESGLLVPVNDAEALAEAIGSIASSPALRRQMGEKGYERVERDFAFTQMTRQYEALYERLLSRKSVNN